MSAPRLTLPSPASPWQGPSPPRRILAVRLQATGDLVITLPYLRALKESHPTTDIDLVTREEVADIPRHLPFLRRVFALGGGRDARKQAVHLARLLPTLLRERYDAVVDLQNNRVSRLARTLLRPQAWSEFDRIYPLSAGERTRRTIEAAGFQLDRVESGLPLRDPGIGRELLCSAGWDPDREFVILSPAGAFRTRNWPLENYAAFARDWSSRRKAQFAVLGLPKLQPRAESLKDLVGTDLLNLVGKTTPAEALAIVQRARLALCEDGGLMHMAWASGVPTLALFGSSVHVWSAPLGTHSLCLHSADLPCGECMQAECRYGDVRCLTRYAPGFVVEQAEKLLERADSSPRLIFDGDSMEIRGV